MAWRRRRKGEPEGTTGVRPTPPPGNDGPQVPASLPDARGPGTTTDREASKRLKQAEADLKRLERREKRVQRAEIRRQRARGRRLDRIESSRRRQPYAAVAVLATANGLAAAIAVLLMHFPDRPLYDPLVYTASVHWEVIAMAFIAGGTVSVLLLARNPSIEFQERARRFFMIYFGAGLIIMSSGALVALVLDPLQDWQMDFDLVLTVLGLLTAGAGVTLVVVHYASRSWGSRWFLSARYHQLMGVTTAVLVVGLILLGLMFLASEDLMFDVGLAMVVVGALTMLFPLPALVTTLSTERFHEMGALAAVGVLIAVVLILLVLSGWVVDEYLPGLTS